MWVVRELSRMLVRIAFAVAVATIIAGIRAAASGGGLLHTWKIMLLVLGCFMFLLAGAGSRGSAANRRVNARLDHGANFILRIPGIPAPTEGPTLTATAVFAGSGIALLALGLLA